MSPTVKMFCNVVRSKDTHTGWNGNYEMSRLGYHSQHCFNCSETMACPTKAYSIPAKDPLAGLMWQGPLCCQKHSMCQCPDGMKSASCTASALKDNVPLLNFFTDTPVPWLDAWQQKVSGQISHAIVAAIGLARVVSEASQKYALHHLEKAKNDLEKAEKDLEMAKKDLREALGPLRRFNKLYKAENLEKLMQNCDKLIEVATGSRRKLRYTLGMQKGPVLGLLESNAPSELKLKKIEELDKGVDAGVHFLLVFFRLLSAGSKEESILCAAAMCLSGTKYVAYNVRQIAGRAWTAAKVVEHKLSQVAGKVAKVTKLENVLGYIAKLNIILTPLLMVFVVSEVAVGMYEDWNSCGCCLQNNSAFISLPSSAQNRVVHMRKAAFEQVFPDFPWRALKAADVATNCLLSFKVAEGLAEKHQSAMINSVLSGLSRDALDVPTCFVSAFQNLTLYAQKYVSTLLIETQFEIGQLRNTSIDANPKRVLKVSHRCMEKYNSLQEFTLLLKDLWAMKGEVERTGGVLLTSHLQQVPVMADVVKNMSYSLLHGCNHLEITSRPSVYFADIMAPTKIETAAFQVMALAVVALAMPFTRVFRRWWHQH